MSLRHLIALPLACGLAFVVLHSLFVGGAHYDLFLLIEIECTKTLAIAGFLVAASAFKRGEYMRRAWLLNAAGMAFLLGRDLFFSFSGFEHRTAFSGYLTGVWIVVANLTRWLASGCLPAPGAEPVWGCRGPTESVTWRWAPGSPSPSPWAVRCSSAVCFESRQATRWRWSVLGPPWEISCRSVWSCHCCSPPWPCGGMLGWPWAFLTAGLIAWLLYDVVMDFAANLGMTSAMMGTVGELVRCVACAMGLSAGLGQRLASRRLRQLASA